MSERTMRWILVGAMLLVLFLPANTEAEGWGLFGVFGGLYFVFMIERVLTALMEMGNRGFMLMAILGVGAMPLLLLFNIILLANLRSRGLRASYRVVLLALVCLKWYGVVFLLGLGYLLEWGGVGAVADLAIVSLAGLAEAALLVAGRLARRKREGQSVEVSPRT